MQDSVGQMKVTVFDNESNPYKKVYEGVFTDDKSYEKWTVVEELGIQLPFLNKLGSKKKKDYKMERTGPELVGALPIYRMPAIS